MGRFQSHISYSRFTLPQFQSSDFGMGRFQITILFPVLLRHQFQSSDLGMGRFRSRLFLTRLLRHQFQSSDFGMGPVSKSKLFLPHFGPPVSIKRFRNGTFQSHVSFIHTSIWKCLMYLSCVGTFACQNLTQCLLTILISISCVALEHYEYLNLSSTFSSAPVSIKRFRNGTFPASHLFFHV